VHDDVRTMPDVNPRELTFFIPIILMALWLGLYPKPYFSAMEASVAQLIAQYRQPLYSLIARSVQDPADAADIIQDVFIKVFRNIGSFHGDSTLRTWLYRIATNACLNALERAPRPVPHIV